MREEHSSPGVRCLFFFFLFPFILSSSRISNLEDARSGPAVGAEGDVGTGAGVFWFLRKIHKGAIKGTSRDPQIEAHGRWAGLLRL